MYTLPCVKQVTEISSVLCGDLEGWGSAGGREAQERGHICIYTADSLRYTAETNANCKAIISQ